uniref:Mediator of RNA polymerase II transcription subunit 8 n=2 Tax=Ciona intestinalis TaxID=7719 RepID=F6U3A5_CIOIN
QANEAKVLEMSVDALIVRAKAIRKALEDFLFKLTNEHQTLTWPTVLDNFALLSGQISSLLAAMKSEKMPALRNYPIVPVRLSPDPDPHLLALTEGRVSLMSHTETPNYLRTKPDPAVEQAERQLISEVGLHTENVSNAQSQVAMFNKQCNKVLEKVKTARANWRADTVTSRSNPPTFNPKATEELVAAAYFGRGLKPPQSLASQPQINTSTVTSFAVRGTMPVSGRLNTGVRMPVTKRT